MRKFRFKLDALERVRKSREDEALRALGQAQRGYQESLERKQSLLSQLSQALMRREDLAIDIVGPQAYQLENDFISGTKIRVMQQDQAILRAKRSVEKALRIYLNARRQTRAMELLREKAHAEFKKDQAKREQRDLDDLYVMRARMARGESA